MNGKLKSKLKKASVLVLAVISIIGYLAIPPTSIEAAEKIKGDIAFSGELLSGSYSTYSTQGTQYYSNINITPESGKKITKVVVRNKNTKEQYKELPRVNDTTFDLGTLSYSDVGGTLVTASNTVTSWDGVWYWFRAPPPDDNIWMYDLNGSRYFHLNSGVYPQPQANSKLLVKDSSSRIPNVGEFTQSVVGNKGRVEMDVSLPMYLNGDGQSFELSKFGSVSLDAHYDSLVNGLSGYLDSADVSEMGIVSQNLSSRTLRYGFTGSFVVPPIVDSDNSNGRVVGWKYRFNATVKADVFKWPNLEIAYWEDPVGASVSPSSPIPTPTGTGDDLEVSSLTFTPSSFTPRDDVTFTYVIKNNSARALTEFYYKVGETETLYSGSLPPGGTISSYFTRKIESPFTITVKVDSRNNIAEYNEGNNEKTVTAIPNAVSDNNPPEGRLRWFYNGTQTETSYVVEGTRVDLRYIDVKDPDGDAVGYRMEFSEFNSTWLKNLMINKYGPNGNGYDSFSNIDTTGGAGSHYARGRLIDSYGGYTDLSAGLTVVPPNPIAFCAAPDSVKSRRPVADGLINSYKSTSPLDRAIDHSKSEWTNKLPFYVNDTLEDAEETIILNKVYDSNGLGSLNVDSCRIVVKPDLPPIAKVIAPALGLRGESFDIVSESGSPDGDVITDVWWHMQYDANNDGIFDDVSEPWTEISGTLTKYEFVPNKVGKYRFKIKVREDYGKEAEATSSVMNVVNLPGEVSFDIAGNNPNPDSNMPRLYSGEEIKRDWGLVLTNSNTHISKLPIYNWRTSKGSLLTGGGKGNEIARIDKNGAGNFVGPSAVYAYSAPLNNNGRGKDGISIYKAFSSRNPEYSQPLYYPSENGTPQGLVSATVPVVSDNKYLYVGNTTSAIYALNKSKIGRYELKDDCNFGQYSFECRSKPIWKDGNPYDYSITQKDIPESVLQTQTVAVNDKGNTFYTSVKDVADEFRAYFAERYIYATFVVKRVTSGQVYYDEEDYSSISYMADYIPYACSFRSEDKQLISCFTLPGERSGYTALYKLHQIEAKGSNLLLLLSEKDKADSLAFYGYGGSWQYEVNHKGEVISSKISGLDIGREEYVTYELKQYVFPQIYTPVSYNPKRYSTAVCTFDPEYNRPIPYDDGEGGHYLYVTRNCRDGDISIPAYSGNLVKHPELNLGVYLAKYDSNYQLVWRTKLSGTKTIFDPGPWGGDQRDSISNMIINTKNRTIVTKSLVTGDNYMGEPRTIVNDLVSMDTGYAQPWTGGLLEGMTTPIKVDAWGNYTSGTGAYNIYNQVTNLRDPVNSTLSSSANNAGSNRTEIIDGGKFYQEYVGDGLLLSGYNIISDNWLNPPTGASVWYLDKGDPVDAPSIQPRYEYGQFISNDAVGNSEFSYTFEAESAKSSTSMFGFSFRMQDGTNRYSLEFDGNNVYLSKYLWGNRTILASNTYNVQNGKDYSVKIRIVDNLINVWINRVPYFIKISDGSLANTGKFGPFSDKSFITFKGISVKPYSEADIWGNDYAILDENTGLAGLNYSNINFVDPEGDPMAGDFFWSFTHQPMFLNNKGLSPLNGRNFTSGLPTFDRVGKWEINLKAKDDPAPEPQYKYPNAVFDSYRQETNSFRRTITVHRRPVTHELAATVSKDGDLQVTDNSYDPDRYDISTGYAEPGYSANKGVFERRYVLVSPSNRQYNYLLSKLDESGTWVIGLQVRDEFGAWSYMETVEVEAYVKTNHPPTAVLTYPVGTEDFPVLIPEWSTPTVTWTQNDQDPDTVFIAYELELTASYTGSNGQPTSYTKIISTAELSRSTNGSSSNMDLRGIPNRDFKVRVRVKDEETWSEWSNYGYYTTRIKPTVELTYPLGTHDNPTYVPTLKPTFTWNQHDPAAGIIYQQEIEILDESGSLFLRKLKYNSTSEWTKATDSWTMESDITPAGKFQVRVRVRNGANWSSWSNVGWFTTNRPPTASMSTPFGTQDAPTVFATLRPTFVWNQYDQDPGTVFSYFQLQVTNEANTVTLLDSGQQWQNTSNTWNSWVSNVDLTAGEKLRVRVRVFDGYTWSDWSAQTWFYINRAPTASFTWAPNPLWEGDTVTLTNTSTDPDGDALNATWWISGPGGFSRTSYDYNAAIEGAVTNNRPGTYYVTLVVTDPHGATATVTHPIYVGELGISGAVNHTADWEANRQAYNAKYPESQRSYDTFWAGEQFDLVGTPTNTGSSATKPTSVSVSSGGIGSTGLYMESYTRWLGNLGESNSTTKLESLSSGSYDFVFTVTYSNGVQKQTTVRVYVNGNWSEYFKNHRIK